MEWNPRRSDDHVVITSSGIRLSLIFVGKLATKGISWSGVPNLPTLSPGLSLGAKKED